MDALKFYMQSASDISNALADERNDPRKRAAREEWAKVFAFIANHEIDKRCKHIYLCICKGSRAFNFSSDTIPGVTLSNVALLEDDHRDAAMPDSIVVATPAEVAAGVVHRAPYLPKRIVRVFNSE